MGYFCRGEVPPSSQRRSSALVTSPSSPRTFCLFPVLEPDPCSRSTLLPGKLGVPMATALHAVHPSIGAMISHFEVVRIERRVWRSLGS